MPDHDFEGLRRHAVLSASGTVREAVIQRGLLRRRRAGGGVVAAAAMTATACVALLLPGGTANDALLPPDVATIPSESPPRQVIEPDESLPAALPSPVVRLRGPSLRPGGPAQADAAAGEDEVRAGAPAPARSEPSAAPGAPAPRGPYEAMTRTRRDGAFGGSCVGGEQQLPDGGSSCPRDNPDVGPSDAGGRTVGFHSCQFDDGGKRRLRFATEEEVVLTIRDASDRVVWRWKPERPYTSRPHEETLAPASCLFWSTRWAHVDDAGQPVPRGVYVLFVDYLELDDEFEHRNTFTY